MGSLKWKREETVYVGDSNDDMLAGRDAGIRTLAAQWMTMVQDQEYKAAPNQQSIEYRDPGMNSALVIINSSLQKS
ncbi:HAD hydrolase-like protein [Cohnella sp. REN36]|uniref:HAD family hydrolase n=1 Tax=Cohnella sp. REN36 TaxID=2887347 RepID=UPI001D15E021|nr:HAD family hydrolase [Cohnella sp. REN36]